MIGRALQAVFDEKLVQGVGGQPGVDGEDLRRGGRGSHTEHRPSIGPQLLDGRRHRRRLARPRRPHHQHQLPGAGHRPGRLHLRLGQVADGLGVIEGDVPSAGGQPALGPDDQPLLLGQDVGRGQRPVCHRLGDGAAVPAHGDAGGNRRGQLDEALGDDPLGQTVQLPDEDRCRDGDVGGNGGGQLPHHLGGPPRRLPLGQRP